MMSIDIVYSNSNGSITASTLVEMAEEWMNGIRTANGFAFQINRPGTNISVRYNPTCMLILIRMHVKY